MSNESAMTLSFSREVMAALPKVVDGRVSRSELLALGFTRLKETLEREIREHAAAEHDAEEAAKALVTSDVIVKLLKNAALGSEHRCFTVDEHRPWLWKTETYGTPELHVHASFRLPESAFKFMPKAWLEANSKAENARALRKEKEKLLKEVSLARGRIRRAVVESTLESTPEGRLVLKNLDAVMLAYRDAATKEVAR